MCEKDKQNSERSDRPDELGSHPVMETTASILRMFLLHQIVSNLLKMYDEYRKNSERSDRPDETGSDPNMHMFSPQTVHIGWRAAVVPRQDRRLSLEFFIRVPFPFVPYLPPTPTTVPDKFHEMPLSLVFVRQDFGRKLTAMSIWVIWRILYGTVLDHWSYFLSGIHHIKPCFAAHIVKFPLRHDLLHDIVPCFVAVKFPHDIGPSSPYDEDLYHGYEIDKSVEDEISSWIDDLYSEKWSPGYEHYQHLEENNISPTCKTKSSDGEAENWNQLPGSSISYHERGQCHFEFPENRLLNEDNCSSSTHKDCGILGENMISSNDVGFMFPIATELPCSDPALKQGMATVSPIVPHVTTSPSLLAPTQPTLMAEETGAQSLQCSTKSTAQDNLGHFLEEKRSVEMDEKLELTPQCIQIPQPATFSLQHESFSNGAENMQPDSPEPQLCDATNTRGEVSAENTCIAISCPEKKNTIETRLRNSRMADNEINYEDLKQHFDKKRLDAAKSLGVSLSKLKRVSRRCGIPRWPFCNKKLVTECVQGTVGAFSPTTSSHTYVVGSNYQKSKGSKPRKPQREKKMSPCCKKPSIGRQTERADQMLENSLSTDESQLQEQNIFHHQRQDVGSVTIKATYGEDIVRLRLSSTSGTVELKQELAKKLELEHGSFNVKYQDDEGDWIKITCDGDLQDCVTSSTSMGHQVVKLLVLDKVNNSRNSGKAT